MFEDLGLTDWDPRSASVVLGLALGLAFGALAQFTAFCFRRAVIGPNKAQAQGIWAAALLSALIGTQILIWQGWVAFDDHRFFAPDMAWVGLAAGGVIFGAGMVLTRGCAARSVVLAGSGNLRSAFVILVFAVTAHATMKGILSFIPTTLNSWRLDLGEFTGFAALPGGAPLWAGLLALALIVISLRARATPAKIIAALALGALVPLAWVGTGFILQDAFDPIETEGLSFTAGATSGIFWVVASTATPANFAVALLGGTALGAGILAALRGQFAWVGFETPRQMGRYSLGAALMGIGGVLAGGCTIGAGLSGIPTLSFAALWVLVTITAGATLMNRALQFSGFSHAAGELTPTPAPQPAE